MTDDHSDDQPVSTAHYERGIGMVTDQLEAIREELRIDRENRVSEMVQALTQTFGDEKLAARLVENLGKVARRNAAEGTGNFIWNSLRGVVTHWITVVVLMLIAAKALGIKEAVDMWNGLK